MAREFLLRGVDPEELKPAPKMEPPKTPQGKWENFWYHYKWTFWGSLFAVVVLVVLVVQLFNRNPADYEVLLVTEHSLLEQQIDLLEEELAGYGTDLDGDGAVEVRIQNCFLAQPGSQSYYSSQQILQTRIFSGDVMLFLWEPKYYEEFLKNISDEETTPEFFTALPFAGDGVIKEGTVLDWHTDELRKHPLLEKLPKQIYAGVRINSGTASGQQELMQACIDLLKGLATGEKPAANQE